MTGNGCIHYNTTSRVETRWNSTTEEWETWEVTTCDNPSCGAVVGESKKG